MPVIYSNNASTTLSSGINNSTTTVPIASASGFPSIGSGEYYFATIANTNNTKIEVVKVTAGTTSLTVTRAQDGTTAQAFDSGDNFQLRVTAATLEAATKTDVNITAGAISGSAISNDAIDSQHYADGSIDTAHIGDDQVTADKLANSINTDIATGVTGNTTANAALPKAGGAMTGAITTNSTFDGVDIATRDAVLTSTTTTANAALPKAGGAMTGAITTNSTFDGRDVATDGTKLDGIEASADVTDATNVTAAGALMDSEVTNLAEVKAFAASDYATAAQGTLATNALPKSGGAMTGAITTNSTFDGVDIATRDAVLTSTTTTANAALPKAGGTMTGDIVMGANKVGADSGDYIAWTANTHTSFVVNGNEEMRLEADGDLHVDGDVIAYSTTISDATLKYDINPVEFALDKINQLKGVSYKYKHNNRESAGLLAQDVEKVMPSAVNTKKLPLATGTDKEYKTLHYDSMTAILVEAIKELTAKVKKLENK